MERNWNLGSRNQETSGHSEMDEKLGSSLVAEQIDNDGLADAVDAFDAAASEDLGDLSRGVLKVWGLLLVQTSTMRWPWMRAWTPLATVSTSGSSGMYPAYLDGTGSGHAGHVVQVQTDVGYKPRWPCGGARALRVICDANVSRRKFTG